MVRAIRKTLKEAKSDGVTLAEVNGSLFGAVSDAVYDFDLCYNVFHDVRKQPANIFVERIRCWLHEQQYSEIPDLLRLRYVESHDTLRAQLWYGTRTHRNLVALTAFIHGIPLIYHEQESGHLGIFQKIFNIRKAVPELNGGNADYLGIEAPSGMFACLRSKNEGASIILIDFNEEKNDKGVIRLAWNRLPDDLRSGNFLYCKRAGVDHEIRKIEKDGSDLRLSFDSPSSLPFVYVLRKSKEEFENSGLLEKLASIETCLPEPKQNISKQRIEKEPENHIRFDIVSAQSSDVLYIDPETGLPAQYLIGGTSALGKADIILPAELKNKAQKPVIRKSRDKISVKRRFGNTTLEIEYISEADQLDERYRQLRIESRWLGKNIPKKSTLSLSIVQPTRCLTPTAENEYLDYQDLSRRPAPEGFYGSIYWRPQGSDIFYDSILFPWSEHSDSKVIFLSEVQSYSFSLGFGDKSPVRIRQQGPIGEKQNVNMLLSWTDEDVPQLPNQPAFSLILSRISTVKKSGDRGGFRAVAGGWQFENEHYSLRMARNGMIMSLQAKSSNGLLREIVRQSDLYTDHGYGSKKVRYAAGFDVEAGVRIFKGEDGTFRARFEGQIRGRYRYDLLKPPIKYYTEYTMNSGPVVEFSCGVYSSRIPYDSNGFLALVLPVPQINQYAYHKNNRQIAKGNCVETKGRSYECKGNLPERILLKNNKKKLLELFDLRGEAVNIFMNHRNLFIAFDDGILIGKPNSWRRFSAKVHCGSYP